MAIAQIHQWLTDPDRKYGDGVKLFDEHNPNPGSGITVLIHSGENALSRQKLIAELRAIATLDKPEPKKKKDPAPEKIIDAQGANLELPPIKKKDRHVLGETTGYPPHLIKLDRETLFHLKELEIMVHESVDIEEGEELRISATNRALLDRKIARAYQQLNYYAQNLSVMPGTEPESELQRAARLMRALIRNRPYISKNKNSTDPEVQHKVKAKEAELEEAIKFMEKHEKQ